MLTEDVKQYIISSFGLISDKGYQLLKLSDGYSEAEVYILEVNGARRQRDLGTFILKIIDLKSENDSDKNEAEKTRDIYEKANNFRKHLVKIKYEKVIENKLVMILSFTFDGKFSSILLAQIKIDNQCKLLRDVSYDLLKKLNYGSIENTSECSIISSLCLHKLQKDGNFICRMQEYVREVEYPALNIKGIVLPNPYYYIVSSEILTDILKEKNIRFIKGFNHGDLHQKNIMISRDYMDYVIIDYDKFETNFLLFDQAYLELSSYIQCSDEWDFEKWMKALEYMFRTDNGEDDNVEFSEIIHIEASIREGIHQWYEEERPECMDDFKVQLQLARIAAGIDFFSKGGIIEERLHMKYLAYICYGIKELFSLVRYKWDNSKASWMEDKEKAAYNADKLWNECGKLRNEYIKILITNDIYEQEHYQRLATIGEIDWRMIVDIGEKKAPNDLMNTIVPIIQKYNGVNFVTDDNKNLSNTTGNNTSLLQIKKGRGITEFEHWKEFKNRFKLLFKTICGVEPLKPVLLVLDIAGESLIRNRLIEMLLEDEMIQKGSRFICFGKGHELPLEKSELEEKKLKYYQHKCLNLLDIVNMIKEYGLHRKNIHTEIYLPCIESLDGYVTEEVYNGYKDTVELIYPGMDNKLTNYANGEDFYKGNEISWEDIVQKRDIEWKQYDQWKKILLKKLQIGRISECKLLHGAGAGGTTLSKRLMWDIKDLYPSLRIKKYTSETANIIIDVYRKTGRCVLVVMEMGSTIISEDEYESVKRKVNAQSCHALFLKVERSISNDENAEISLSEDLKEDDARNFLDKYSTMTSDSKRIECLNGITYDYTSDEWRGQCCPFFYGFYTFQEEYVGLGRFLSVSIEKCDQRVRSILADLSLMTIYSQNICMPYEEMSIRLGLQGSNLVELYESLNEGVEKILVQKDNGFRICHPLIAQKLIELLYDKYHSYEAKLYFATINFVENMNEVYKNIGREYLDKVFKEMFIDRSYIDGEHQKFALLINDLEKQSDKIKVFEKLISLYPDNPHYYNHLGRLEIYDEQNLQFDKAIVNLNKALTIAKEKNYNRVPHLTTLGCIYSKKVISDLNGYEKNVKQLLDTILVDFGNASDCFFKARMIKENSSYAYFPNILMICNVVKKITKVTGNNLETLLKDSEFEKWYNRYSGIALQLLDQMKRKCEEELSNELKERAETNILYLKENVDTLKAKLKVQKKKGVGIREQSNLGRTITMLLYMQNQFRWEGMKKEDLDFAERELEEILESGEYNQYDVIAWFNIYRQMEGFESAKAKRYIVDYMKDGYYKNYLLWILSFWEYEKGKITYKIVEEYLHACKYSSQLTDNNIRSTRNIDIYTLENKGFPIKKFSGTKNENEKYLRTFKGTIVDIDGTVKGKIHLDELDDINITFVPSFTVDDQKKEFKREDIGKHVEFKLVFTYSGYKAWNPRKI